MRTSVFVALFAVALSGCDSAPADLVPEPLTCDLLSDKTNCWAEAASAVAACLPSNTETGVLAPNRASCSFADGTVITFDDPLPNTTEELEGLGFTIEKGGSKCGRFVDTFENKMEMEAGGHTVSAELRAGTFTLACGDGSSYEASFDSLFDCPAGTQPTDGFGVEPALVTFRIFSVATPGELFRCAP